MNSTHRSVCTVALVFATICACGTIHNRRMTRGQEASARDSTCFIHAPTFTGSASLLTPPFVVSFFHDGKFCPECRKRGKKSEVYEVSRWRTVMGVPQPYWDTLGVYHCYPDPNYTTVTYSCSNGHRWTEKE